MPEDAPATLYVVLADEVTRGQVTVSLEGFVEFALRLDADLTALTERFAAFSTPNAAALRRQSL
jgi:hypothetical protein